MTTSYVVSYASDYNHVDGVTDATYYAPESSTATASGVKLRKGSFSRQEVAAGFGVSPTDLPVTVWLGTLSGAEIKPEGRLNFDGADYRVVQVLSRLPDNSQGRYLLRKYMA
jgi:hypothetical protein